MSAYVSAKLYYYSVVLPPREKMWIVVHSKFLSIFLILFDNYYPIHPQFTWADDLSCPLMPFTVQFHQRQLHRSYIVLQIQHNSTIVLPPGTSTYNL